jgi:hypothetical protein
MLFTGSQHDLDTASSSVSAHGKIYENQAWKARSMFLLLFLLLQSRLSHRSALSITR